MKRNLSLIAFFAFMAFYANFLVAQTPRQVFDFETLSLPDTGFWNGSDQTIYKNGNFGDNMLSFPNNFTDYGSYTAWDHFAFSSWTDTNTEGFDNQWSVFAGEAHSDSTFGLCNIPIDWANNYETIPVDLNFSQSIIPEYFYITNSSYTALSIKNGSAFSSPFSTANQDYYKIIITAFDNDYETGSTEIILADYTVTDSSIVDAWTKVDLSSFGAVTKLTFNAVTTDVGDYGPNTPLYFCMDDFVYSLNETSINENSNSLVEIYPNPSTNYIKINSFVEAIEIYDISGRLVKIETINTKNPTIAIDDLQTSTYFVRVTTNKGIKNGKFVKI